MPLSFERIIQVEVTTVCQAGCGFCPRTLLKADWISKNIEWENFTPVLARLRRGMLVHLQGWGEPLLHPRLWDMAAAVRQKKGSVSLTTNALLMDDAASREISRIGLEFVAISLADANPAANERLRSGTSFDRICSNIQYLCSLKKRPRVHIDVQMVKTNLEHLPEIIELAARLGADRVIASNLDCLVSPEVDALRAFSDTPDPQLEEMTAAAKRRGRELKIEVEAYPLHPVHDLPVCKADPLHTTVITVSGELAPCTYLSLPLRGDIPRIFQGKTEHVPRFVFADAVEGIERTTKREPALSFLTLYKRRRRAAMLRTAGNLALLTMPRLRSTRGEFLEPGSRLISPSRGSAFPAAPGQCRYCYKLLGM